jgi:hypothetical protein
MYLVGFIIKKRTAVFTTPMNNMTNPITFLILPYLNQLLFDKHFNETCNSANNEVNKVLLFHYWYSAVPLSTIINYKHTEPLMCV